MDLALDYCIYKVLQVYLSSYKHMTQYLWNFPKLSMERIQRLVPQTANPFGGAAGCPPHPSMAMVGKRLLTPGKAICVVLYFSIFSIWKNSYISRFYLVYRVLN